MTKVSIIKKHGKKWGRQTLKHFEKFGKNFGKKMEREVGKVLKMESFRVLKKVRKEGLGFFNPKKLEKQVTYTAKRVAHDAIIAGRKRLDREIRRGRSHNLAASNFVSKRKAA